MRLVETKTSSRGRPRIQHLRIDHEIAVKLIQLATRALAAEDKLFPFGPAAYRSRWDKLTDVLGLHGNALLPGGLTARAPCKRDSVANEARKSEHLGALPAGGRRFKLVTGSGTGLTSSLKAGGFAFRLPGALFLTRLYLYRCRASANEPSTRSALRDGQCFHMGGSAAEAILDWPAAFQLLSAAYAGQTGLLLQAAAVCELVHRAAVSKQRAAGSRGSTNMLHGCTPQGMFLPMHPKAGNMRYGKP